VGAEEAAGAQVDVRNGQVLDIRLSQGKNPWPRLRVKVPVDAEVASLAFVDVRKRSSAREPRGPANVASSSATSAQRTFKSARPPNRVPRQESLPAAAFS